MDDYTLIKSYLDGDRDAFETLVKKHQQAVARLVYSILKNESAVYDVVQDVFLAVYRGIKKYRGDASFKTWIYRITVHEALRYVKKYKRHDKLFRSSSFNENDSSDPSDTSLAFADLGGSPEHQMLDAQTKQLIQDAINKLSDHHRLVLQLHYQEDVPVEDIAKILEIPIGSVKSRLYYARVNLKELLSPFFKEQFSKDSETDVKGKGPHVV